jgi:hypothetical protein
MNAEIALDQLVETITSRLATHGFDMMKLEEQLRFCYRVGWKVGFDEGFSNATEVINAAEKGKESSDYQFEHKRDES